MVQEANAITQGLCFLHAVCGQHQSLVSLGIEQHLPEKPPTAWVQACTQRLSILCPDAGLL